MPININLDTIKYIKSGVALRDISIDESALEKAIGGTTKQLTVLSQHPTPGTTVMRGTPIDVVLAFPNKLPLGIIPDLPQIWKELEIGPVAEIVRNDPRVLEVLDKHETSATMSSAEREVLVGTAKRAGVQVDAGNAASLDGALNALRGANQLAVV